MLLTLINSQWESSFYSILATGPLKWRLFVGTFNNVYEKSSLAILAIQKLITKWNNVTFTPKEVIATTTNTATSSSHNQPYCKLPGAGASQHFKYIPIRISQYRLNESQLLCKCPHIIASHTLPTNTRDRHTDCCSTDQSVNHAGRELLLCRRNTWSPCH